LTGGSWSIINVPVAAPGETEEKKSILLALVMFDNVTDAPASVQKLLDPPLAAALGTMFQVPV